MTQHKIAFQGAYGAFSDLACRAAYPDLKTVPCASFYDALKAVSDGHTDLAMIPVENTIAGRVADVHALLPEFDLHIIGEHFEPISHNLLGIPGTKIDDVQNVFSHVHALPQCRQIIRKYGLKKHVFADTASSAMHVAEVGEKQNAAIASTLAAEIYNLDIIERDIQDNQKNTTRFLVLSAYEETPEFEVEKEYITTLLFRCRNISAALYKCLGGFATNGINLTRLESYVDDQFGSAEFFCDVQSHYQTDQYQAALEELQFYAETVRHLGTYSASPFRRATTDF